MKKIVLSLALLAIAALLPATQSSDEEAIKQVLIDMWAAVEAGDVDAYASHVHPEFTAFGENDVYLAKGKDLELRGMADYFRRVSGVHTQMHQPEVTVRGDTGWITYYWTDSGMSGDGRFTSRGKSTRIFVRESGKWLCIHGHYTAVP